MSPRAALVYEHVAFDLDGTLIDSRADLTAAVNHVLRRLGLAELPPATLYRYVGDGARVLVERALGSDHQDRLEAGVEAFMAYYAAHLLDATRPYPRARAESHSAASPGGSRPRRSPRRGRGGSLRTRASWSRSWRAGERSRPVRAQRRLPAPAGKRRPPARRRRARLPPHRRGGRVRARERVGDGGVRRARPRAAWCAR